MAIRRNDGMASCEEVCALYAPIILRTTFSCNNLASQYASTFTRAQITASVFVLNIMTQMGGYGVHQSGLSLT